MEGDDNEEPVPATYVPLDPLKREEWLTEVEAMSDKELRSPRIDKIMAMVDDITIHFPNEKIVIVSRFVRFLDILQTAMKRKESLITTEFTGYVNSARRIENLRTFGHDHGGPVVLFLSATAGGTGLNITRASHLIICEPPWTPGISIQVEGRVFRLGQTRTVYVYNIFSDTLIDLFLTELLDKKQTVNLKTLEQLVRPDDQPWF